MKTLTAIAHLEDARDATTEDFAHHLIEEARAAVIENDDLELARRACRITLDRHLVDPDARAYTRRALHATEGTELLTDGGATISTGPRVPCDYCGGDATGYDLKERANLCNDCAIFPSALVEGRSQLPQVDEFPEPLTDDAESPSRCNECGDLLVVRDGEDTRCVECLLDHLAVAPRPSPGVF